MDTIKVETSKLQMLNDRIAQTIDALNQLRLSAHGLQQSGAAFGLQHSNPVFGQQVAYGQVAYQPIPTFAQPMAAQTAQIPQITPQFVQAAPLGVGLSHSSPIPVWQARPQPFASYPVAVPSYSAMPLYW